MPFAARFVITQPTSSPAPDVAWDVAAAWLLVTRCPLLLNRHRQAVGGNEPVGGGVLLKVGAGVVQPHRVCTETKGMQGQAQVSQHHGRKEGDCRYAMEWIDSIGHWAAALNMCS